MQIGIDLGATKIEYVLLDNKNKEITKLVNFFISFLSFNFINLTK